MGPPDERPRFLRDHIDQDIRRDAVATVAQPLEEVGIGERTHAYRTPLVIDLTVRGTDLELAHELRIDPIAREPSS